MVIDKLENLEHYATLHPRFPQAFAFLRELLAQNAPDGRHILPGTDIPEEIYVSLVTGTLEPQETARAESHKRYIDVQLVLSGTDVMYVPATEPALTEESDERDCQLYAPVPLDGCHRLTVGPNVFAIFFTGELHAPCHSAQAAPTVSRKAILKVLA